MFKIIVFVPEDALSKVKGALFKAGAGNIGHYSHCCWQVLGVGQFMPGEQSEPAIGNRGSVCEVSEYRLETVCDGERIRRVLTAMLDAHPYETPAYEVLEIKSLEHF
ncbi:NGG1p interacting factor NIF3 [Gynuella sp.]|uniref:NGG1p interacting factor NIF3 n=1 Tax=Gynuella sp. TaxID=2969146 RepID=UPI003D0CF7AB